MDTLTETLFNGASVILMCESQEQLEDIANLYRHVGTLEILSDAANVGVELTMTVRGNE